MKTYQNKLKKNNALDFLNETDELLEHFGVEAENNIDISLDSVNQQSESEKDPDNDLYSYTLPIETNGYAKFVEAFNIAGRLVYSGHTSYSKEKGNHITLDNLYKGVYVLRITTIKGKHEIGKKVYYTSGKRTVQFEDIATYRVANDTFKMDNKPPYSEASPKEKVKKGTEISIIKIIEHGKNSVIKVKEVKTNDEFYLKTSNILRKPDDTSTSFDWMKNVHYDDKVTKNQLVTIQKNREGINDRTDKTIYGSGGFGRKTLDKVGKGGYVFYGEKNTEEKSSNDKDEEIEVVVRKILEKELLHEGIYSSINTYDGEFFTWGKGFAITGQLYEVFDELNKKEKYKQIFKNVGITIANKTIQIVNNKGIILKSEKALSELKENTQLLSFFMELAEKEDYMKDVADAQDKVFSENAGKVPSYVVDKEKNDFADNWNKSSISVLAHLSHWLPGKGWKKFNYSDTKGELYKILYEFIYNTVKTNNPVRKRKLDNSIYEWNTGKYNLLNKMKNWGDPKGIGLETIGEKWSSNFVKLKFEKDSDGVLRVINTEKSEYISNDECALIKKSGDSYIVLTKNAEKLKYKELKNEEN